MTIPEVAEELRVSIHTIRRLIDAGQLPAKQVGKQWRIRRAAVVDYMGDPEPSETDKLQQILDNRAAQYARRVKKVTAG